MARNKGFVLAGVTGKAFFRARSRRSLESSRQAGLHAPPEGFSTVQTMGPTSLNESSLNWIILLSWFLSAFAFIRMLPEILNYNAFPNSAFIEIGKGLLLAIFIAILAMILIRLFNHGHTKVRIIKIFYCALMLRLTWALFMYLWSLSTGRGGAIAADDLYYYELGINMADSLRLGESILVPNFGGYFIYNAILNLLTDNSYFVLIIVNSFIGSIIAVLVFKLALLFYKVRIGYWAALLVAASPELSMWSATNLKDIHVTFCIVVATYCLVSILKSSRKRLILIISYSVSAIYLLSMRPVFAIFMFGLSLLYYLLSIKLYLGRKADIRFLFAIIILIGIFMSGYYPGGRNIMKLQKYKEARETLALSYKEDSLTRFANPQNIQTNPLYFPIALGYSIITPFPFWKMTILPDTAEIMLASPGVVFLYIMLFPALYGVYRSIRRNLIAIAPLIGWVAFIWVGLALETGGSNFRYRASMMPFLFIFSAVGWEEYRKWKAYYPISILVVILGCIFYVILKSF